MFPLSRLFPPRPLRALVLTAWLFTGDAALAASIPIEGQAPCR